MNNPPILNPTQVKLIENCYNKSLKEIRCPYCNSEELTLYDIIDEEDIELHCRNCETFIDKEDMENTSLIRLKTKERNLKRELQHTQIKIQQLQKW